jgi:hypothetical protein
VNSRTGVLTIMSGVKGREALGGGEGEGGGGWLRRERLQSTGRKAQGNMRIR